MKKIHFFGPDFLLYELYHPINSSSKETFQWYFENINFSENLISSKDKFIRKKGYKIFQHIPRVIFKIYQIRKYLYLSLFEMYQRRLFSEKNIIPNIFLDLIKGLRLFLKGYSVSLKNFDYYIVPENVYINRFYLAGIFSNNPNSFCISSQYSAIYKITDLNNNGFFNPKISKNHKLNFSQKKLNLFLEKRNKGFTNNSEISSIISTKSKIKKVDFDIVIFLHVFGDTQFQHINKNRIFYNHLQFVNETIQIIENKNLKLLLKFHPSSKKWGENPYKIYKKHIKIKSELVSVDFGNEYKTNELFQSNCKIVTFSGSVALESLANGKIPIIINSIGNYFDKYVKIPITIDEYKRLLLSNRKNDDKLIYPLYFKEKYLTMIEKYPKTSFIFSNSTSNDIFDKYSKIIDWQINNRVIFKNLMKKLDKNNCFVND